MTDNHKAAPPQMVGKVNRIPRCTLVLAFLGLFLTAFAYGGGDVTDILTPEERLWLTNNQSRLVLAVETGYAPFVFIDANNQPTGLAHDYLNLIQTKLGVHFKQERFSSLDDIFHKVRSGEVHIVNAVTKTPARSTFLAFTEPFISVPNVIVVRKDRAGEMREENLAGLRVSLVKSYAVTETLIGKNLGLVPDLVPDDLSALLSVSFGRSDAAVLDLATASYLITQKGITNLRVAGQTTFDIRLSMGAPTGEPILLAILAKGLAGITAEEKQDIHRRWINISGPSMLADWRFWAIVGGVLSIVLVVITAILIWNRTLRKQVRERKEAERKLGESEARLRTIIMNEPECIKIVDAQGRLIEMNPAGLEMIEADSLEQVAGRPVLNLIAPEYRKDYAELHRRVLAGEKAQMEYEVLGLKGGRRWLETHAVAMRDQGETVHLAVTRDISERKRAEAALKALNETLEQRVQEGIAQNMAQERLLIQQSRLAAMGEMIGNIAHQWRQPLNTLNLLLANLKDASDFDELNKATIDSTTAKGQELIEKMSTTIDDFRNFFKPNREKQRFKPWDAIEETIKLVSETFRNNNIEIELDKRGEPCEVIGYPNEFSQVVLNALSNAKEAVVERKVSGKVLIHIEKGSDSAIITIRDNGIGIPEDVLSRLFEPYFTTKEKGTGIGLYMSQRIMEHMDGDIAIRNIPGGVEVRLTLPLAQPAI